MARDYYQRGKIKSPTIGPLAKTCLITAGNAWNRMQDQLMNKGYEKKSPQVELERQRQQQQQQQQDHQQRENLFNLQEILHHNRFLPKGRYRFSQKRRKGSCNSKEEI
jgi:hypothetical protein